MKRRLNLLLASTCMVGFVALVGLVVGLVARQAFVLQYAFNANFIVGAVVISSGLLLMFAPAGVLFGGNKFVDRFTFFKHRLDAREQRQQRAQEIMWIGIANMVITGCLELLFSLF